MSEEEDYYREQIKDELPQVQDAEQEELDEADEELEEEENKIPTKVLCDSYKTQVFYLSRKCLSIKTSLKTSPNRKVLFSS
jgi:hypothetical protein